MVCLACRICVGYIPAKSDITITYIPLGRDLSNSLCLDYSNLRKLFPNRKQINKNNPESVH